ncbi:Mycobacterium numidiamassiliense ORFan [Mycobacterium numidiamassiliense]|uniref:Mycobacterium numidiamassiliense ORFan n=2 Tax=Mycobacterium TaxID=1763 RepID=A0A2U3PAC9_9MYCO|nr:Mycobacterium numidiamassiliense ORFan [Mycobacterium numidiamassiliense]
MTAGKRLAPILGGLVAVLRFPRTAKLGLRFWAKALVSS